MNKIVLRIAVAAALGACMPAQAQQPSSAGTCVEAGRSKVCHEAKVAGLNSELSVTLTMPADVMVKQLANAGVQPHDQTVLFGCRVVASNPAAQTDAVFGKLPQDVRTRMNGARITGASDVGGGLIQCQFQTEALLAASGPYAMTGTTPKEIEPCAQKLVDRINATHLTVKRQTRSTMFFKTEHNEFTARCALYRNEITAALSGEKVCKPTLSDLTPLFDMIGAPEKDRKKLFSLATNGMRKSKRTKDAAVAKWNDYELTASDVSDDCTLIVYPPMPDLKG